MRARAWIFLLMLLAACAAQAGTRHVKSLDGIAEGTRVRIEGMLSMRGSTPLTILVLEVNGAAITLKPHDQDIQQALRSLDGLRVALEGQVIPRFDPEIARLEVDHYELLAPPGAGDPIIGVVALENGACVLTTDQDKRYWIVGDLAPALCQHAGARVWMVGKKSKHGDGTRPRESTAFTPTGYGVIDNAP
jgi:predicted nucleic acid-binding protein